MPERRYKGKRRWGMKSEYPLIDSAGLTVIINRRNMPDRRLGNITLEQRQTLFAEMPQLDDHRPGTGTGMQRGTD